MKPETISVRPLNARDFAPFGELIEIGEAAPCSINEGNCERFHDLANVDVLEQGGRPLINIFRAQPFSLPFTISMMERHPLSSQAFVPLASAQYVVVVAPPDDVLDAGQIRAFISHGNQGVNYGRGVWHHPLLALDRVSEFLVVDRGGKGENCDEVRLTSPIRISGP